METRDRSALGTAGRELSRPRLHACTSKEVRERCELEGACQRVDGVCLPGGGERRQGAQLAHRETSSEGTRYDKASARCSAATRSAGPGERRNRCVRRRRRGLDPGQREQPLDGSVQELRSRGLPAEEAATRAGPVRESRDANGAGNLAGGRGKLRCTRTRQRQHEIAAIGAADVRAARGSGRGAAASTCTRSPGRRAPRRNTGSSCRRAGTGLGTRSARQPARRRSARLRGVAGAPPTPGVGTRAARRGAARRDARASPLRGGAPCRRRPRPPSRPRVVRRPERRNADQATAGGQQAGYRVNPGYLESGLVVQPGQDPGQSAGEHRLPDPGWAREQQVVRPGGDDLERAAGNATLTADVGQIGARMPRLARVDRPGGGGSRSPRKYATASARWRDRHGLDPGKGNLGSRFCCADWRATFELEELAPSRAAASAPGTGRSRPSSASSPTGSMTGKAVVRDLPRGRKHGEGDRQAQNPGPSLRRSAGARLTVIRQ